MERLCETTSSAPRFQNRRTGDRFGHFEMQERLGVGGMASVHRAIERLPDGSRRVIALKRMLPHLADNEDFVHSFAREARLASMLDHPNIVRIYESGAVDGEYFISMEYVDGLDLRRLLRQAYKSEVEPSPQALISLLLPLCRALDYAHTMCDEGGRALGLVHRDISPSNVLISTSGEVKIIDFGIARASMETLGTRKGDFKGKLSYMSPDSLGGQSSDARSDLWALGVLAHELITSRPLFQGKNDFQTIQFVQDKVIEAPNTINDNCPLALGAIVLRALQRDVDKRWQSAGQIARALEDLAAELQIIPSTREIENWCQKLMPAARETMRRRSTVPITGRRLQERKSPLPTPAPGTSPDKKSGVPQITYRASTSPPLAARQFGLPAHHTMRPASEPGHALPPARTRARTIRDEGRAPRRLAQGTDLPPLVPMAVGSSEAIVPVTGVRLPTQPPRRSWNPLAAAAVAGSAAAALLFGLTRGEDGQRVPTAVSAEIMEKLEGSSLTVQGDQGPLPEQVRALLCVDPKGSVISSSILSEVPEAWRSQLRQQFRTWSYSPVGGHGQAEAACFVDSFPLTGPIR